eukprot:scaffold6283_cov127-Isochrysis_galbana.AAC.9
MWRDPMRTTMCCASAARCALVCAPNSLDSCAATTTTDRLRLATSGRAAPSPVVQADFLLLRKKDPTRVVLGKVIAAPKGGVLLESDLCSVVEYECASPTDGLLGPVRPRLNPFYPKQGLQHLRVSDVKRDAILVYAVQCDFSGKGDERKIRIKHDYLQRLAAADATFSMPIAAASRAASGNPRRSGSGGTSARRQPAVATLRMSPRRKATRRTTRRVTRTRRFGRSLGCQRARRCLGVACSCHARRGQVSRAKGRGGGGR